MKARAIPTARKGRPYRLTAILAVTLAVAVPARAGGSLETAIKATYLYKFAPFVGWPEGAVSTSGPFTLCIAGADPFGPMLDRAIADQKIDDRPIVPRRLDVGQRPVGCQILYIGGSPQAAAETIRAARGLPVLTVAEGPGTGAVIGFVVREQRVRFVIDIRAAAENNLKISSKLLSLALDVQAGKP